MIVVGLNFHRGKTDWLWVMIILTGLLIGTNSYHVEAAQETRQISKQEMKKFNLYATDGYQVMPDGKKMYIWGYSLKNEKGTASYPSPTLEVNEGDLVEVTLTNIGSLNSNVRKLAHTIHFHGLDTDQFNDGVPHTSTPVPVGESFTYRFTATHAGTYFYHCHVDTIEHLQMGMHGALIVKAKDGVKTAWTNGKAYDKEYVFQLSEFDPVWHLSVEGGKGYDRTAYHPRYFMINGKSFPNTEQDSSTTIEGKIGETILIRIINAGYQEHSIHTHGHHFQVIATDGRPLTAPYEKDTILIGPGERYDILVTFEQNGHYPLHSHNITDNLNDGVYPGGMHTVMKVGDSPNHPLEGGHDGHSSQNNQQQQPTNTVDSSSGVTVLIENATFSQKELRIAKGTTVTWINKDSQIHPIVELNGLFDSGTISANGKWSYTFEKAGTYTYYCSVHPTMQATVIVE